MPLEIYRRGKVWHFRGTVGPAGRRCRLRGSCSTTEKDIAARHVANIEKSYWDGHFDGPGSVLTFERACLNYIAVGKPEKKLKPAREHFGNMLVKDITPQAIQEFAMRQFGHCAGASRNRQGITPVVAVINHAAKSGLCNRIRVEHFGVETKEKEPAALEWIEAFQRAAPPHLGALALFMFLTGARPREALAVDREHDLDLQKATVVIRQTKVGRERTAHLPAALVAVLAELEPIEGRPLFGYKWYDHMLSRWNWYVWKAKLPRLTPHCCRHGFATGLLRAGHDVHTVAWLGGWASPAQVLKTYGHAIKRRDLTDTLLTQPTPAGTEVLLKTGTS